MRRIRDEIPYKPCRDIELECGKNGIIIAHGCLGKKITIGRNAMTIDPVCGTKVDDKNPEFETKFAGRKYVFCSEKCQKEFENAPEEYVETAA